MQTGDVQLIVGWNIFWRWGLRGWPRKRSCCAPHLWQSVLDDLSSFACQQLDRRIATTIYFPNVRPAGRQVVNFFEDDLAARCDKQLRVFERFRNANPYLELAINRLHVDRGKLVGVLGRTDLLNRIPELTPGTGFVWR